MLAGILVLVEFEKKRALSAPKNTGRRVLYKTIRVNGGRRDPFKENVLGEPRVLGAGSFSSLQNQTESLELITQIVSQRLSPFENSAAAPTARGISARGNAPGTCPSAGSALQGRR